MIIFKCWFSSLLYSIEWKIDDAYLIGKLPTIIIDIQLIINKLFSKSNKVLTDDDIRNTVIIKCYQDDVTDWYFLLNIMPMMQL